MLLVLDPVLCDVGSAIMGAEQERGGRTNAETPSEGMVVVAAVQAGVEARKKPPRPQLKKGHAAARETGNFLGGAAERVFCVTGVLILIGISFTAIAVLMKNWQSRMGDETWGSYFNFGFWLIILGYYTKNGLIAPYNDYSLCRGTLLNPSDYRPSQISAGISRQQYDMQRESARGSPKLSAPAFV